MSRAIIRVSSAVVKQGSGPVGPAHLPVGPLPALQAPEIARSRPHADIDTLIVVRPESAARESRAAPSGARQRRRSAAARSEAPGQRNTDITGFGIRLALEFRLGQKGLESLGAGA